MNRAISKKQNLVIESLYFGRLSGCDFNIHYSCYRSIFNTRESTLSDNLINLKEEQVLNQEGTYYVYVYSRVGVTESKWNWKKLDLELYLTNT